MTVPALRSPRLRLDPLDPVADAAALLTVLADPEVGRFLPEVPADVAGMRVRLRGSQVPQEGFGQWTWRDASTREVVGRGTLLPVERLGRVRLEVSWHLARDRWGQGLATEAVLAQLQHAERLGLRSVDALVASANVRSLALVARLGGRFREGADTEDGVHEVWRVPLPVAGAASGAATRLTAPTRPPAR